MTLTIPTWLLWTLGIVVGVPAVIALVGLALLGIVFLRMMKGGIWR